MANIEHLNLIKVPAAKVYAALTTESGLAEVWTRSLKVRPEVGFVNEFTFGSDTDVIKTIELIENKRVVWQVLEGDPEWLGTIISFDLIDKGEKTEIYLNHANWKEITDGFRWCNYHWGFFLYSLKTYCEEGKGIPYQDRKF